VFSFCVYPVAPVLLGRPARHPPRTAFLACHPIAHVAMKVDFWGPNHMLLGMGVCAFVASGVNFDLDRYLQSTPLEILCVFHKGEVRPDAPDDGPRPDSGFAAVVSHDDFPHLLDQVSEAQDFLETHEKELDRLKALGADHMALDFRVAQTEAVHCWTAELISAMARWQMELVFSAVQTEESSRPARRRFRAR
jgi:hypothetical protein